MRTTDEIIQEFLMWLTAGHSPETVKSYRYALNAFRKWLIEDRRGEMLLLKPGDIGAWQMWLEKKGLKGSTRFHYATALRSMWRWLAEQNEAPWSYKLITMPDASDKERMPALELEDFARIMAYFDERFPVDLRDKTIIALFFDTGLRLSELVSLDISSLNMLERFLNVRTFKRRNHHRDLFWTDETHRLLTAWLDLRQGILERNDGVGSNALFVSLNTQSAGRRIHKSAIQRRFRKIRAELGLDKKITPHSCRHGFGTYFGKRNPDVFALKELMGHANIKHTSHYVHLQREDLREAYETVKGLTDAGISYTMPPYAETGKNRTQYPNRPQGRARVLGARHSETVRDPLLDGAQHHHAIPELDDEQWSQVSRAGIYPHRAP